MSKNIVVDSKSCFVLRGAGEPLICQHGEQRRINLAKFDASERNYGNRKIFRDQAIVVPDCNSRFGSRSCWILCRPKGSARLRPATRVVAETSMRKFLAPILLGLILVTIDLIGVLVRLRSSKLDAGALALIVPGCFLLVAGVCWAFVVIAARSRAARTAVLAVMFPDAIIENVSDQPGSQLYKFRSFVRARSLVVGRYLERPEMSIVVCEDSVQGWIGGKSPRRAFLLRRSDIDSVTVGRAQATPLQVRPAMKVALTIDGVAGDVYFSFGGGTRRNSWSLMTEGQTRQIVRAVNEKLALPQAPEVGGAADA